MVVFHNQDCFTASVYPALRSICHTNPLICYVRIPMKPAIDSETKPATCSDFIPASIPI